MLHRCNDYLRNAVAFGDLEIVFAQIGEDHFYLAAIVAVDRAWRVEASDTVSERKPRTRAHLHFIARRNSKSEAGCDIQPFANA